MTDLFHLLPEWVYMAFPAGDCLLTPYVGVRFDNFLAGEYPPPWDNWVRFNSRRCGWLTFSTCFLSEVRWLFSPGDCPLTPYVEVRLDILLTGEYPPPSDVGVRFDSRHCGWMTSTTLCQSEVRLFFFRRWLPADTICWSEVWYSPHRRIPAIIRYRSKVGYSTLWVTDFCHLLPEWG